MRARLIPCKPFTVYGAALLDHALIGAGFDEGALIGEITGELILICCEETIIVSNN